jgi:hypothetical protein
MAEMSAAVISIANKRLRCSGSSQQKPFASTSSCNARGEQNEKNDRRRRPTTAVSAQSTHKVRFALLEIEAQIGADDCLPDELHKGVVVLQRGVL